MALLLLLIVLSVIFYNSFLVEKKDISKKQEPKTYEILKKIDGETITFELLEKNTNQVENQLILQNVKDPEIHDLIIIESSKGNYYIHITSTVIDFYYEVYNQSLQKISEDRVDNNHDSIPFDGYEIQENGDIMLYYFEENPEQPIMKDGYTISSMGKFKKIEDSYNQEGQKVNHKIIDGEFIAPQHHVFAYTEDELYYTVGNHGVIVKYGKLEKEHSDAKLYSECRSEEEHYQVVGQDEDTEWIHLGEKGSYAKKYVYHIDTGKVTVENSNCLVE